jgi:uncharacterized protein (TIGR02145 family)
LQKVYTLSMKHFYLLIFLFAIKVTFSQLYTPGLGVTDVDANNYPTIIINGQEWMAENMRTTKFSNGDSIPRIINGLEWVSTTNGAWTYYNNNDSLNYPYGKLYNWYTINDSRNVCPSGWRVPSTTDFDNLVSAIGGYNGTAMKLKVTDSIYWSYSNPFGGTIVNNGTNLSGFSGVPAGFRYGMSSQPSDPNGGPYATLGNYLTIWTTSPALNSPITDNSGNGLIWVFLLRADSDNISTYEDQKESGHSIRCMRESTNGINLINPSPKKLVKILNIMGQETSVKSNEIFFYLYNDGSIEKKIKVE